MQKEVKRTLTFQINLLLTGRKSGWEVTIEER